MRIRVRLLTLVPAAWVEAVRPRKGSADEKILPWLLERPVFEAKSAAYVAGIDERSIYRVLDRLTEAGVLSLITQSQRNRAWAATEVLDEVDRLNRRLAGKFA